MEKFSKILTDVAVENHSWDEVSCDDRKRLYTSFGKTADGFKYVSDAFSESEISDWYELLLAVCEGLDKDSLEDLQIGIFDILDKYLFDVIEEKFQDEKNEQAMWS